MALEDFFTWGKGGRKMTPDQLEAERAALAVMQAREGDTSPVAHWSQGLGRVVNALAGNYREGQADKAEAAGIAQGQAAMDPVLRALMGGGSGGVTASSMGGGTPGGTWTPAAPPPSPTAVPGASGGLSMPGVASMPQEGSGGLGFTPPPMTPQQMIVAGAEARGLDPIDVATAISYETGGKFDPMISGPTTQWGTHRGLIQFGEPQAQQYGADFSSPQAAMTSQLNPENGAVWNYLDQTGVQPGMGLDNIYSAINAGAPGRFNASDANNGGAPGTVADKVAGMGDHRAKAAEFLGGAWTPNADAGGTPGLTVSTQGQPAAPQGDILSLLMAAQADPWAAKQYGPVINALMGSELTNRQQAQDPLRQLQIQQAQLELQKAQRPAMPDPFTLGEGQVRYDGAGNIIATGTVKPGYVQLTPDEVAAAGLKPGAYQRGPDDKIYEIGGGGVNVTVGGGPDLGKLSTDYGYIMDPATGLPVIDPQTGLPKAAPVPGSPAALEIEAQKKKADMGQDQKAASGDLVTQDIDRAIALIDKPGLLPTTGFGAEWASKIGGTQSNDLRNLLDTVKANAAFDTLSQMRAASPTGGALGAVSDRELTLLSAAKGALDQSQSPKQLKDNLIRLQNLTLDIVHGPGNGPARKKMSGDDGASPAPPATDKTPLSVKRRRWNPENGAFE